MNTIYPMTLLYDGACPVCSLEMDHLRERDSAGRLVFVDISAAGFEPEAHGATLEAMRTAIHGRLADGRLLIGVPVLRLAYGAVGLGWLWKPTGWGPLRPLADAGYRVFARHRQAISSAAAPLIAAVRARRAARRMRDCQAGRCDTDGGRA
jgi:predicted DCC family thiol-disulfide oxidoreductase YuxK